ncbi:hypothetical protein WOLCODRAFT_155687 [Wolfiporia cocos MD-104 SS10]|uniref:Uncharacterized protein n=1 Tax=Wolfiporia cocos (strain MD-104) TaxID=742152 RepID=A0A2H3J5J6_WOLCO|nr:hypothetical protein WOLCODRAFT_155687 [Wolfiporia cocos MD-104 SS10]
MRRHTARPSRIGQRLIDTRPCLPPPLLVSHLYATSIRLGPRRPQARTTLAVRHRHCVEGCDVLHSPKLPRCEVRGMEPENQCTRCATVQTVDLSDAQRARSLLRPSWTAPSASVRLFAPYTRHSECERPASPPRLIASQVFGNAHRRDEHSPTILPSLI